VPHRMQDGQLAQDGEAWPADTTPDQYPYFVRVRIYKYADLNKYAVCGGSVIDPGWILTAAHCMTHSAERSEIAVDVLVHDSDYLRVPVVELILHPLWDGDATNGHDLALLRVATCATEGGSCQGFSNKYGHAPTVHYLTPMMKVQVGVPHSHGAPPDSGAYAAGVTATIVGHGATEWEGGPTIELRDLHTPLHSDAYMEDNNAYNLWPLWSNWDARLMIGAGWTNHTACDGDSGGPLTVNRNGVTVQVGVASFVSYFFDGCDRPGAYAELSGPQLAWVAATVPGVTGRWGLCWANTGRRSVGLEAPSERWVATYEQGSHDVEIVEDEIWNFSCVPVEPDTMGPGIVPRFDPRQTLPAVGPGSLIK
jgi:secreted trypsin-like serine protease